MPHWRAGVYRALGIRSGVDRALRRSTGQTFRSGAGPVPGRPRLAALAAPATDGRNRADASDWGLRPWSLPPWSPLPGLRSALRRAGRLQAALHDLRARGWQTAVLHIVDDAEVATDAAAAWLTRDDDGIGVASLELVDRESGAILRLAPDEDLVARYAAGVTAWLEGWKRRAPRNKRPMPESRPPGASMTLTVALLHERGLWREPARPTRYGGSGRRSQSSSCSTCGTPPRLAARSHLSAFGRRRTHGQPMHAAYGGHRSRYPSCSRSPPPRYSPSRWRDPPPRLNWRPWRRVCMRSRVTSSSCSMGRPA